VDGLLQDSFNRSAAVAARMSIWDAGSLDNTGFRWVRMRTKMPATRL